MSSYSALDKLLHRLALGSSAIAELSFDLDQRQLRSDPAAIRNRQHVFVVGLARAGTTILMRNLYATGAFRSLTYRDMPFVLAPNLWRKFNRPRAGDTTASERAHGDRILVSADSPESLDEVFWRVFSGDTYLSKAGLRPHEPGPDVLEKYVAYVAAILQADEAPKDRYLSKNNNNILRLPALRRAFPNALILIPFRDPQSHAMSLLRQHHHFLALQAEDRFVRAYMTWLGHHEFGQDHRPFQFDGTSQPAADPGTIDYWLQLWTAAYSWLEKTAPTDAVFVCYEDLCSRADVWKTLAGRAGLDSDEAEAETFKISTAKTAGDADPALSAKAAALYDRLAARTRAVTG